MRFISLLCGLLLYGNLYAAIDVWQFQSLEQEQQYRELTGQLRCPKCQNNSIADSNAMIAADMRTKVWQLMQQGKNRQQIIDYMVTRYGNFVTYQPPLTVAVLVLWGSPVLFLLTGSGMIIQRARHRIAMQGAFSAQEQLRLAALLMPPRQQNQLQELRQDKAQRVAVSQEIITALPQNLLTDIPDRKTVAAESISHWALLPGVVILIAVSLGLSIKTGALTGIQAWQHITAQMPQLRARATGEQAYPLSMKEIADFGLGLRTSLETDSSNVNDWIMLSRVALVFNNVSQAIQASARAWQLQPNNPQVKLAYAQALSRSGDRRDIQHAAEILSTMVGQSAPATRVIR